MRYRVQVRVLRASARVSPRERSRTRPRVRHRLRVRRRKSARFRRRTLSVAGRVSSVSHHETATGISRRCPLHTFIGRCRSPQGGGTGPGRVRTGRACCAVEVARPSHWPEEDATGPPAEARTSGRAAGPSSRQAGLFVRSFVSYVTRPAVGPSWGTNCAHPAASGRVHRGY